MNQPKHPADQPPTIVCQESSSKPRIQSMHEDIAVWEGGGSCGAEPYWIELGAGMDLAPDSDDEDGR